MQYRRLGRTDFDVSVIALGGHEYHPDGRLKGVQDEFEKAIKAGYKNPNFASPERRKLVQFAVEQGVNYFDVTIDPEVEAIGTCLRALPQRPDVLVQCRPQGLCYKYQEGNTSLANLAALRPEVERLHTLMGLGRIGVLNFGFESEALARDPDYFRKVADVIAALKKDGLIRYAACDSLFSGEEQYLRMVDSGVFDIVWITLGPLAQWAIPRVFPRAKAKGMGIVVREAFAKGQLFKILDSAPLGVDAGRLAAATIRWALAQDGVATLVVGARDAGQFGANLKAASDPFGAEDQDILTRVLAHAPKGEYARPETTFFAKK
jgi:aryl-alcohol dehydrogenase-like predicted oxidoreductase